MLLHYLHRTPLPTVIATNWLNAVLWVTNDREKMNQNGSHSASENKTNHLFLRWIPLHTWFIGSWGSHALNLEIITALCAHACNCAIRLTQPYGLPILNSEDNNGAQIQYVNVETLRNAEGNKVHMIYSCHNRSIHEHRGNGV